MFLILLFLHGSNYGHGETGNIASKELRTLYKTGLISRETYVIQQIESLFKKGSADSVSKKLSTGLIHGRSLTPLLKEAIQNYMFYSDESRNVVDRFLMRPDNDDDVWPWSASTPFYLPSEVLKFTPSGSAYPNTANKFTFWYVTHSNPDTGGHVHTSQWAFVEEVAKAFETSYTAIVNDLGFAPPVSDSGLSDNGGDGKRDVYLMNCGDYGLYGYTTLLADNPVCPAYIVLDNDFQEFETSSISALDAMRVTVAHEFHHTVQFSINSYADIWIMEATSCWAESLVYPNIPDNIQYLNGYEGFFSMPYISLDDEDYQIYNSWIFLNYMSLLWGEDVVKHVWNYLELTDDGIDAITSALSVNQSSLRETFTDFALKNYSQDGFYPDADVYDEIFISNSGGQTLNITPETASLILNTTAILDHLSAAYYKYLPGKTIADSSLLIEVNGPSGKKIQAAVTVKNLDGTFMEIPVNLNTDNDGYVNVENFTSSQTDEVVLTLVNYSSEEDHVPVEISGGIDLTSSIEDGAQTGTISGSDSENNGCFVSSCVF